MQVSKAFGAAAFALALALGGCGGRPSGVLKPVAATVPDASKVDLFVVTTRKPAEDPGQLYSGDRDHAFNYAEIAVSIPPDAARKIGDVQWPGRSGANPATDFVTLRADRLDEPQALKAFHARVAKTKQRRVLVFVHGFNTKFEEAVYRFAQIVHDSKVPAVPVLFTWPSRGKILAYGYDHESANYSRDALERLLQFLKKDPSVGEIDILAHSMGNWVTLEALRQMSIRDRGLPRKLSNVMLAAPDVDVDVFRRQIVEIGERRPGFTLFVSRDDNALAVSRRVWGGSRIGEVDPKVEPYRSLFKAQRINVVDLTEVETDDRLGHTKFAESPEVVQAIGRRMASGQTLNDAKSGLGERLTQITTGAAATVGQAAGVALSAPVAILDGQTREDLGDGLSELGEHAKHTVHSTTKLPTSHY